MPRSRLTRWLLIWGGYMTFALAWSWLWIAMQGVPPSRQVLLEWVVPELLYWNVWALLTPGVIWTVRRIGASGGQSGDRAGWIWQGGVLGVVGPGFSLAAFVLHLLAFGAYAALMAGAGTPLGGAVVDSVTARALVTASLMLPLGLMVFALIAASTLARAYVSRLRHEERRTAALRAQLAEAQLDALKMQLQPHFLFNALNTISSTLHEDPATADRMLADLGDFLRLTLDHAHRQEVPLADELDFARRYLQIEQHRLEDRLSVDIQVDAEAARADVPYLLLQPLVENAMRHGISAHLGAGKIAIHARAEKGCLRITVDNTGPALGASRRTGVRRTGIGLSNTRARLQQAYGDEATLDLADTATGVRATILLPLKSASSRRGAGDGARLPVHQSALASPF